MSNQRIVEFVSDNELSIIVFLVLGWILCFTGIVDMESAKLSAGQHRAHEQILSRKSERYTSASVAYGLLGACLAAFLVFTFYNKILRRGRSLTLVKVRKYNLDMP